VCADIAAIGDLYQPARRCAEATLLNRRARDQHGNIRDTDDVLRLFTARVRRGRLHLRSKAQLHGRVATVRFIAFRCDRRRPTINPCRQRTTRRVVVRLGAAHNFRKPRAPHGYTEGAATITIKAFLAGRAKWPGATKTIALPVGRR